MLPIFQKEKDPLSSLPRTRYFSVTTDLFRRPVDDTPQSKVFKPIKADLNYLESDFVTHQNDAYKINTLISDFFENDVKQAIPYTVDEWKAILKENQREKCNKTRLARSIKDGLPKNYRLSIWLYLAETEQLKAQYVKKNVTYEGLKAQPCAEEYKIKKDITRSFADHDFFRDNEERLLSMQCILQAYANFDPEVGYTQGMNFLVGMLIYLTYTEYQGKEKRKGESEIDVECEVFWIFVYIMQQKEWRMLYLNNMPKLQELLEKLDIKIQQKLPDMHSVVTQNACLPTCFAQYFLTILLYGSREEVAKRILEIFLFAGEEILHHILIQAMTICQNEILELERTEDLHNYLRDDLFKIALQ